MRAFWEETNLKKRREMAQDQFPVILILRGTEDLWLWHRGFLTLQCLQLEEYHFLKDLAHLYALKKHMGVLIPNGLLQAEAEARLEKVAENNDKETEEAARGLIQNLFYGNTQDSSVLDRAMKHAACLYEDELHRWTQVLRKSEGITDEEWCKVCVIVLGGISPRKGHAAYQYFERLCGVNDHDPVERKKNRRLFYFENPDMEPDAAVDRMIQLELERTCYQMGQGDVLREHVAEHLDLKCGKRLKCLPEKVE